MHAFRPVSKWGGKEHTCWYSCVHLLYEQQEKKRKKNIEMLLACYIQEVPMKCQHAADMVGFFSKAQEVEYQFTSVH